MLIPKDAIIAVEKVRDYLLILREEDDKSQFLGLAGYSRNDYWELLRDIRDQLLPAEGEFDLDRGYGPIYSCKGLLRGPNGVILAVQTKWILNLSGEIRFVTLVPDVERYRNEIRAI